jgi:transforming growth factor-beta-induced protein
LQTASNGVVHFIDDVIYPIPAGSILTILSADKRFNAFYDAVADATKVADRLNSTSKSMTLFAPTDAAFDKLPRSTLEKLAEDKVSMLSCFLLRPNPKDFYRHQ